VTDAVVVIDYGMGNLFSVESALRYLGAQTTLTSDPEVVAGAHRVILPGVGSFRLAMERITAAHLDAAIHELVKRGDRLLGICLGMQLLGSASSEDGETAGLGLVPNRVDQFDARLGVKVPHIGFNSITPTHHTGLFAELPTAPDFYFVHSYRMAVGDMAHPHATCEYGDTFLAAFDAGNVQGAQFHPEKSQSNGLQVLRNFLVS
jgi:glutamine amidotransferase